MTHLGRQGWPIALLLMAALLAACGVRERQTTGSAGELPEVIVNKPPT
jgi:hypothetical protein